MEILYGLSHSLYYIGFLAVVVILYFIARFYRMKLDPETPIIGFIVTIIMLLIATILSLIVIESNYLRFIIDFLLLIAGSFGSWNSIELYLRMKRVYK